MKILILMPADSMGGAEQYLNMVASYYKESTVDIYFLSLLGKDFWKNANNHSNIYFPRSNNKLLSVFKFVFNPNHRKNKTYDYIFTSHVYTTGLIGIMLKLKLIKTLNFVARESTSIFLRYNGIKLLTYKLFYRLGYKQVNILICQTQVMKDQLIKGFPKLEKYTSIKVMPNPIDYSLITQREKLKPNESLPSEYIITAGRLIHEKGYDILIKAFAKIKKDFPNLKLIILGEGDLKSELTHLTRTLSVENDVILWGFVENVYPYFKNAEACVVSSRVEGFPNVLLQMMSQNNKVVSTDCAGGISEIPGILVCKPDDQEQLEIAIHSILESNSDNRKLFDDFLRRRDISSFMEQVNNSLGH